jgi:hypothetical protein
MDTFSHGLWGAAAALGWARLGHVSRAQVAGAALLGLAPDLAQAVPVAGWALTQADPIAALARFAFATPGREAAMPAAITLASHHLHCAMHSLFFAFLATLVAWRSLPALLVPLAGWWLHIALDIPSHSQSYYAVPFLYPFSYWGFDGVAWKTPWMLAANYGALALAYALLAWGWARYRVSGRVDDKWPIRTSITTTNTPARTRTTTTEDTRRPPA